MALEPSVCFRVGQPRRTVQIVLQGEVGQEGARVRWKLTPVEPPPPRPRASAAMPELEAAPGPPETSDLGAVDPAPETLA